MAPSPGSRAATEHTSDTLRPPPDSTSRDPLPPFESGIPPVRTTAPSLSARGEAHAQAALSACARGEANLGSLRRTLQHLADAVANAEEAKEDVVIELDQLRRLLAQGDEEQLGLRHRVAVLEQTLERNERENARERGYLLDQQDLFIGGLWDEHAQEAADYRRRLATSETVLKASQEEGRVLAEALRAAREHVATTNQRLRLAELESARLGLAEQSARDALGQVRLELEEAEAAAAFSTRERDHARAELARLKPASSGRITSFREPQADSSPKPGFSPLAAIPLITRSEPARASRPELAANATAAEGRGSAPAMKQPDALGQGARSESSSTFRRSAVAPEELRQALTHGEAAPAAASSKSSGSTIRQKPDASTRPLIGYSLGSDEVSEERVDSLLPSSRPPR